jgi:hypothetical protein
LAARLETRNALAPETAQAVLWEIHDPKRTNMVALYDLAPRFVYDVRDSSESDGRREAVKREFQHGGKRYRITLKPSQIEGPDGHTRDRFCGEREQIVEEVIRRLASKRGRLTIQSEKVRFTFSVYEVSKELSRIDHTYSNAEIREAITLLNEVRIRIEMLDGPRQPLLSAAAFPVVAMRKGDDDDSETYVEFNPLVADAIRGLNFHQVPYELLMKIKDPVSRWLLKLLQLHIISTGEKIFQMTAKDIRRDSGMPEWKTTRNMLRRLAQSVDVLKQKGVLSDVEERDLKIGKRKDDILFTLVPSPEFLASAAASGALQAENKDTFRRATHGRDPGQFIELPAGAVYQLRQNREQREQPKFQLAASAA